MNARPIIDTASSMSLQRRPGKTRAIPSNPTQNVGTYVGLAFSSHHHIVQNKLDKMVDWCPEEELNWASKRRKSDAINNEIPLKPS